jgi:hypothetical protein
MTGFLIWTRGSNFLKAPTSAPRRIWGSNRPRCSATPRAWTAGCVPCRAPFSSRATAAASRGASPESAVAIRTTSLRSGAR